MSVETRKVVMYTTRSCPFCLRAKALLHQKGVIYDEIKVDFSREQRQEMAQRARGYSVPQIWIGDNHIGGCDELFVLEREGNSTTC
ncbi:MAG: glutaredoxin 3 [Pseudomonadales bacterium]|nr:glutaredoxin 3 [Pseudomonadales bacterium]MDP7313354.1 glutaredoxin 3 [Pseudomonadales bacterium]